MNLLKNCHQSSETEETVAESYFVKETDVGTGRGSAISDLSG
jgi:hypothetical protein